MKTASERGYERARELMGSRARGGYEVEDGGPAQVASWLDGSLLGELELEERLAVVGGRLLLALPGAAMRRRLALALTERGPAVSRGIMAVRKPRELEEVLIRRVHEVFIPVANEGVSPGKELELVGLYAVVMATVLREPAGWRRLEEALREPGKSRARGFGVGALGSRSRNIGRLLGMWIEREFADEQ